MIKLFVYISKRYISKRYLVYKMNYQNADVNFSNVNKIFKRINRIKRGTKNLKSLIKRRDCIASYYDKVVKNLTEKNILLEKLLSTLKLLDSAFYRILPLGYTKQQTYLTTCLDIFILYWNTENVSWLRPILTEPSERCVYRGTQHWCMSNWDWGVEYNDLRQRWNSDEELSYDISCNNETSDQTTPQSLFLSDDEDSSDDQSSQRGFDEPDR